MATARVEHLERDMARADFPAHTVAAIAFARSQSRTGPAGARDAREALRRADCGDDEMKTIPFAVAK